MSDCRQQNELKHKAAEVVNCFSTRCVVFQKKPLSSTQKMEYTEIIHSFSKVHMLKLSELPQLIAELPSAEVAFQPTPEQMKFFEKFVEMAEAFNNQSQEQQMDDKFQVRLTPSEAGEGAYASVVDAQGAELFGLHSQAEIEEFQDGDQKFYEHEYGVISMMKDLKAYQEKGVITLEKAPDLFLSVVEDKAVRAFRAFTKRLNAKRSLEERTALMNQIIEASKLNLRQPTTQAKIA
jgi:hypothetical protein